MNDAKYIGLDVHQAAISVTVLDSSGKLVMECVIETKASTILQFFQGLSGSLHVTFEEGTWAAWLYDLLKPHVVELVVCNPRRNAYMKEGSKSDRIDARKLAELLRLNSLRPVYHGEHGVRTLKELARSYLTISKDLGRVMSRLKGFCKGVMKENGDRLFQKQSIRGKQPNNGINYWPVGGTGTSESLAFQFPQPPFVESPANAYRQDGHLKPLAAASPCARGYDA